jgi:hypothetical protein
MRGEAGIVECSYVASEVYLHEIHISLLHIPYHRSTDPFLSSQTQQDCTYFRYFSPVCWHQVTELPFFATKVRLGRGGAEEILPLGPLNDFERYAS